MKMTKLLHTFVVLILISPAWSPARASETELRIGVLAKRGIERAREQWQPMAELFSQKLSRPVTIVPLKYSEIEDALKADTIHFLVANSGYYVKLKDRYGLKALATMVNRFQSVAIGEFGGVIFTRSDSRIGQLEDLRKKRFMCVSFTSFGGGQAAWRLLLDNGIDPRKDFTAFIEGKGSQDAVVRSILKGEADAGTVRTDTIEKMVIEGEIKRHDLKIIHRINDAFPLLHSTRLYPEWPFVACKSVSRDLRRQITKILHLLNSDDPAMIAANVFNWNYPGNYDAVEECLQAIDDSK